MRLWLALALGSAVLLGGAAARAETRLSLGAPRLQLEHPAPHLLDAHLDLFGLGALAELPLGQLDQGGGAGRALHTDAETRQVLSFILGIIPGFGIGHLLAGSHDGFVLFLIVDVVLLTADILFCSLAPDPLCALGWVVTVVERVFEGYDAYTSSGGARLAQRSVESLLQPGRAEACVEAPKFAPSIRVRSFAFDFPSP